MSNKVIFSTGSYISLPAGSETEKDLVKACAGARHLMRYFFTVVDGGVDVDFDGTELSSFEDAKLQAIVFAAEVIREKPERVWAAEHGLTVRVSDAEGVLLTTISVSARDER